MTQKAAIRVTIGQGKVVQRELMVEGMKVCDMSVVEIIDLIMQATSSLRDWTGKDGR